MSVWHKLHMRMSGLTLFYVMHNVMMCTCTSKNGCDSFIFKSYYSNCLHTILWKHPRYQGLSNNISPWRCLVDHFTLVKQVQEREVASLMANFVELCRWLKTGECLFTRPLYLMVFQETQWVTRFFLINVHLNVSLALNTLMSDNNICSVQNLAHSPIITYWIMICLECNYCVALFIKMLFHTIFWNTGV